MFAAAALLFASAPAAVLAQASPTAAAPGDYAKSLNGYQLPIAMEMRRGRWLKSYERPAPLVPNRAAAWPVPLRDHDTSFRRATASWSQSSQAGSLPSTATRRLSCQHLRRQGG